MMFKEVWNAQKGGGDIGNNAAQAAVNNVVNGAANSVNAGLVPRHEPQRLRIESRI